MAKKGHGPPGRLRDAMSQSEMGNSNREAEHQGREIPDPTQNCDIFVTCSLLRIRNIKSLASPQLISVSKIMLSLVRRSQRCRYKNPRGSVPKSSEGQPLPCSRPCPLRPAGHLQCASSAPPGASVGLTQIPSRKPPNHFRTPPRQKIAQTTKLVRTPCTPNESQ
jgi:hypothetical protein